MNKKINIVPLIAALLSCLSACTASQEEGATLRNNQLRVNVKMIGEDWKSSTRTATTDTTATHITLPCDSVSIDGEEYILEAIIEDRVPQVNTETRGTPLESAAAITSFTIRLFDNGTNANWNENSLTPRDIQVTGTKGSFACDEYEWTDATKYVSMYAYAPKANNATNGISTPNNKELTYAVPTTTANQPDLCIAHKKLNLQNTAGSNAHLQIFEMRHALTAVGFSMKGYKLKMKEIKLSGINHTGTVSLSQTSGTPIAWSNLRGTDRTFSPSLTNQTYNDSHTSGYHDMMQPSGYLMMIPQTLTANAKLSFTFTDANNKDQTLTSTLNASGKPTTWSAGQRITYNIRLKTAPAIQTTTLSIQTPLKGYTTTTPLSMSMATDDELTFSWTATWLRVHRGAPKNGDLNGGAASGWKSGTGGPFSNIYFYATDDNLSSMNRTATVTVRGSKSAESTFTVTQVAAPTLTVSRDRISIHDHNPRPWESGHLNAITFQSTMSENVYIKSTSASWLQPYIEGNRIRFNYDWNVNALARGDRFANIVIAVKLGNQIVQERTIQVYQRASQFFILLNPDKTFNLAFFHITYLKSSGRDAKTNCVMARMGDDVFNGTQAQTIFTAVNNGVWTDKSMMEHGSYWTNQRFAFPRVYHYEYSGNSWYKIHSYYGASKRMCCVTTNRNYLYR